MVTEICIFRQTYMIFCNIEIVYPLKYISNEILHELTYVMKFENTIPYDAAVAVDLAL